MTNHFRWAGLAMLVTTTIGCGGGAKSAVDVERNRLLDAAPASGGFEWGMNVDVERLRGTTPYKAFTEWAKTYDGGETAELKRFESTCKKPVGEFFRQIAMFGKGDEAFILARVAVSDADAKSCIETMNSESPDGAEAASKPTFDFADGVVRAGSAALVAASKQGGPASPLARAIELTGDRVVAVQGVKDAKKVAFFFSASPKALRVEGNVELGSEKEAEGAAKAAPLVGALLGDKKGLTIDASAHGKRIDFTVEFEGDASAQTVALNKLIAQAAPKRSYALPVTPQVPRTFYSAALEKSPWLSDIHLGDPPSKLKHATRTRTTSGTAAKALAAEKRSQYLVERGTVLGARAYAMHYDFVEGKLVTESFLSKDCRLLIEHVTERFGTPSKLETDASGVTRLWLGGANTLELRTTTAGDGEQCSVHLHRAPAR